MLLPLLIACCLAVIVCWYEPTLGSALVLCLLWAGLRKRTRPSAQTRATPSSGRRPALTSDPPVARGLAFCRIDDRGFIRAWYGDSQHFLGLEPAEVLSTEHRLIGFLHDVNDLETILGSPCAMQRSDQNLIAVQIDECLHEGRPYPERLFVLRDITEDVTAQGELMESEAELRLVFDTIDEAVLLLDLDGRISNANGAAKRRYGGDLIGQDVYLALRRPGEPKADEPIRYCLAEFAPATIEQHLSQQNRTVEVHVYPIFNQRGTMRQLLLLERDITNQRMMELEIRVQHQKLQESLERLRELDLAKTKWLHSVSHELRTPLTSIRSYSELLLTYPDTDPATRRDFVSIISRESERLTRLINDLLDLAAIESGELHLHLDEHRLIHLITETTTSLQALADESGVRFAVHCPDPDLHIVTDRDRLQQVIVNLLSNAIKFSPPGGSVLISATRHDDTLHLSVEDEGPGIPAAERRRIFKRFTQLSHNLTDKPKGTGLGLTISGEIVQQLGGLLRCTDPRQLSGACFQARFPLSDPANAIDDSSTLVPLLPPARAPHEDRREES